MRWIKPINILSGDKGAAIEVRVVEIGKPPFEVACYAGTTIRTLLESTIYKYNINEFIARAAGSHNFVSMDSVLYEDTNIILTRCKGIEDIIRNNMIYIKDPREDKTESMKQCRGCGAYPMTTHSNCIYCGNSLDNVNSMQYQRRY